MLSYEINGRGRPLVLIHAFPLSSWMWTRELKELSKKCTVIAPDLPGFGRSKRQAKPSIAGIAREISALLDHLKIKEPAIVCGLSMGGYIVLEFFRQFPKRVAGLGLFSTRAAADTPEGREKRMKSVEAIRANGLEPFVKTMLPNLLGKTALNSNPQLVQQVTDVILKNDPEGVCDALIAMAERRDSTDLLTSIRWPTLILLGEEDSFIKPEDGQALAAIPGSKLHTIPNAGHLLNLEAPEKFLSYFRFLL